MLLAIMQYIRYFSNKLKEHAVSAYAAQSAFFTILSLFPFVMLLMTLIRYLPYTEEALVAIASEALPNVIGDYVVSLINEIYAQSSATVISITVIATIWAASKGILSLIQGFNSIYGIYETRGYIYLRIIASFYTVILALAVALSLILLIFGNRLMAALTKFLPPLVSAIPAIISLRTIIALAVLFCFFLAMYVFVPNRKSGILQEMPGAVFTTIGWVGFSYLYSFYIDNFANFNTYGSLSTIVFLMLWLYFCMYIILIGGEINVMIQERLHQS